MRMFAIVVLALAAVLPAAGIDQAVTRVDVSLGDVSINKVPQLVAADQGLYAKYGLDVHQTISAGAARAAAASGVVVPDSLCEQGPQPRRADPGWWRVADDLRLRQECGARRGSSS